MKYQAVYAARKMFEPPLKTASLMRDFKPNWFIAGGWAIDLFLEKETRRHEDIEIAVFRQDQIALQKHLKVWSLKKSVEGSLIDWKPDEFLELPVHAIHCFKETGEMTFLEVLLNERNAEHWIFRRNRNITKPLSELYLTSKFGVKFLCPEVVLLYKSKNPREKDEQDFQKTVRHLDNKSKNWLKNALTICGNVPHYWLAKL